MAENEQSPWSLRNIDFEKLGQALAVVHTPVSADEIPVESQVDEAAETDDVDVLVGRGIELMSQGRLEPALEVFDRVIVLDEKNGIVHYRRGAVLNVLERPEEALEAFESALAVDPGNGFLYYNGIGFVLRGMGRQEEAEAALETARSFAFQQTDDAVAVLLPEPNEGKVAPSEDAETPNATVSDEPDSPTPVASGIDASEGPILDVSVTDEGSGTLEVKRSASEIAHRALRMIDVGNSLGARDLIEEALTLDRGAFKGRKLDDSDLSNLRLNGSDFTGTSFEKVSMSGTDLDNSDLTGANLKGATGISYEKLASARSILRATMPDGTVLSDEAAVEDYLRSMQSTQS